MTPHSPRADGGTVQVQKEVAQSQPQPQPDNGFQVAQDDGYGIGPYGAGPYGDPTLDGGTGGGSRLATLALLGALGYVLLR